MIFLTECGLTLASLIYPFIFIINELTCRNRKAHDLENELMVCVCVCGGGWVWEEWLGLEGSPVHTTVVRVDNHRKTIV